MIESILVVLLAVALMVAYYLAVVNSCWFNQFAQNVLVHTGIGVLCWCVASFLVDILALISY